MTPPNQDLTALQARFVEEYLVDLDAAAAARRAGYSEKTAKQQGYKNLRKPHIQAALMDAMEARSRRTGIEADAVLAELARVAFARLSEVAEVQDGHVVIKDTEDWPADAAVAVREIRETKHGLQVKMHSKLDALEMLGRHLGLFKDLQEDVLHWIINLPPDRLEEVEQMSDEEIVELFTAKTPPFFPGWGGQNGGRWQ